MIHYSKDIDHIVTLTLDMEGKNTNIINHEIGQRFYPVLNHLKKDKAKGEVKGVIITSGKKNFLYGGELDYLHQSTDAKGIYDYSQDLQQFCRELESPGVPVVAAINGSALGSGFELALACHYRIALDDSKIRLGNPEVTLGIMPGSGGVIRMLWMLGIEQAYKVLSSGKQFLPKAALKAGIIDAIARDKKEMMELAKNWILKTGEGRRIWDKEGGQIPHGSAHHSSIATKIPVLYSKMTSETKNNFPAPAAILNTLIEGSKVDFDTACKIESRFFTKLILSQEAKNMTQAFWYNYNAIKEGSSRPKGFGKFRVKKVGVIGAGLMGSSIAFVCLKNRMEVVLKDISRSVAEKGKELCKQKLDETVEQGRFNQEEADKILENLKTTETAKDFSTCDIVIEAVFENQNVKANVTREAEMFMDEYTLFATNTISIPITKLATASSRPENYVGLHFFAPADKIPLVELVRGEKTSDESIARAFDFIKAIRKIPIVVKDNWGFFAARVQNTFILEGITLLQEGYNPVIIENLSRQAGMPKSPLALADDISLEIVLQYEDQASEHYGTKYVRHPATDTLSTMINELNRKGSRKNAGFYEYENEGKPKLFVQVIEAVWCLQEGVVKTIEEGNLGSIYGWGFPAFKGGVFQFINDYGIVNFIEKCEEYEKRLGPRFKVPKKLREMASLGEVV